MVPLPMDSRSHRQWSPGLITPAGTDIFGSGRSNDVAPNTILDVNRMEQDIADLTPGRVVSDFALSGIDPNFGDATLYTWTAGLERKIGNLTGEASYVGTARKSCRAPPFPTPTPTQTLPSRL